MAKSISILSQPHPSSILKSAAVSGYPKGRSLGAPTVTNVVNKTPGRTNDLVQQKRPQRCSVRPSSLLGPSPETQTKSSQPPPPRVTFRLVVVSLRARDSHPFFASNVASGCCFLLVTAAGAPAGVVAAFAEPSGWCAGAVLDVAGCAVCASVVPSSWRIEVVLVVAGFV